jgi:hypothetical protein
MPSASLQAGQGGHGGSREGVEAAEVEAQLVSALAGCLTSFLVARCNVYVGGGWTHMV